VDAVTLRKQLVEVDDETWAKLGTFFSSYVSDDELERWIKYQKNIQLQDHQDMDRMQFGSMLMYFLENVFKNAERYSRIPEVLKRFCESSDEDLIKLGVKLSSALRAHENLVKILEFVSEIDHQNTPSCSSCGCIELINNIENLKKIS
jgi:hypothetical protein